ncbi:LUD domain-containing protein [Neptuniibacter sp. 2_MG-2023]|uniref:LutC/YkgG family protein n=1 Tax=Neptuniibacter sp. 2_MG-2023 TaxID=3062671 RepID=UPI0026E3DA6C|nr:LUD domain-containing protein [Neptuniibacter sp. 2_MG-2023]MDO6514276.1 LUD domain-containing protein [Neptuniibacter sp. 2_MG-2023]
MNKQRNEISRERIFDAIRAAAPTVTADVKAIQNEALEILGESEFARPALLAEDAAEALTLRIEAGLVIGTSCEKIASLDQLPDSVNQFLAKYALPAELKVQEIERLKALNWDGITTEVDIKNDNTVGLCWAEYGIAETGTFVVHSGPDMPILLNFLPLYLLAVIPKSKILPYMDDYALIAGEIAQRGETPRNMCLISGVSGTTDIEGVLIQGAHGPEVLHMIIVEDQ